MQIVNKTFEYETKGKFDIHDITDEVVEFITKTNIQNGLVNIQTLHTTATVFVNENEPLLLSDIKKNLERLAPEKEIIYQHDNFDIRTVNMCDDECANGHSHCKAMYLPQNVTLNLTDGKITFGRWQRILHIELDRARPRKVQVLIIGE